VSIRGTAQITRAMQMVASSKMRKAQEAAISARPLAKLLYQIQRKVTTRPVDFQDPLQEVREVRKRAVILVAADKGLCGALNSNVFRLATEFDPDTTVFITAGRKAAQFVAVTRGGSSPNSPMATNPNTTRLTPSRPWRARCSSAARSIRSTSSRHGSSTP
jgi:F-type H+-transporting ATPase subunit gamma